MAAPSGDAAGVVEVEGDRGLHAHVSEGPELPGMPETAVQFTPPAPDPKGQDNSSQPGSFRGCNPPPTEADIIRMRWLGMTDQSVQGWFEMTEHPYTAMASFVASSIIAVLILCALVATIDTNERTAAFVFQIPAALLAANHAVTTSSMWIVGPPVKAAVPFVIAHCVGTLETTYLVIASAVAPEALLPLQHRLLSVVLISSHLFFAVISAYFIEPAHLRLRLSGSLRGLRAVLMHAGLSTFKVFNCATDVVLAATLLRLVSPTFAPCLV